MTTTINKKAVAAQIFVELKAKGLSRKEIIFQFTEKAGLTVNGASTYYANFNGGCWADAVSGKAGTKSETNVETKVPVELSQMSTFELTEYFNKNCTLFKVDRFTNVKEAVEMITKYCK